MILCNDKNDNFLIDQQLCSNAVLYYPKKSYHYIDDGTAPDFTGSTRNYAFIFV